LRPRPKSQTYPSRVTWIAAHADRAAAAASLLGNFGVFGENMARLRGGSCPSIVRVIQ